MPADEVGIFLLFNRKISSKSKKELLKLEKLRSHLIAEYQFFLGLKTYPQNGDQCRQKQKITDIYSAKNSDYAVQNIIEFGGGNGHQW